VSGRLVGIETEYGIAVPGMPQANPMTLASQIVTAYAATLRGDGRRSRWDFEEENPLRDARGYELRAAQTDHGDGEEFGMANALLPNGARFYVDHAHPEYSTPEVLGARAATLWDKAGERILERSAQLAHRAGAPQINLYKNNVDGKGASYGTHENYLMPRATPFSDIVRYLTTFLVSRIVVTGQGRVGLGSDGRGHGYQISQRADYMEVEVGLETTLRRPIINTRDEPHADAARYRRLHVIIGDANLAEFSTFLKVGSTSLILDMIEAGALTDDLALDNPVAALRSISHDPSLVLRVTLRDGRVMGAVDLQRMYHSAASAFVNSGRASNPEAPEVIRLWGEVLDDLERDPMLLADRLDWVAKLAILDAYRERDALAWSSPRLAAIDLQYADVRQDKGLYNRLAAAGRIRRLVDDDEVSNAISLPPDDTRAYFRGRCIARFPEQITAASWDSVVFDVGGPNLIRVPTGDPFRGTREHVGGLLDAATSAGDLVEALGSAT
jgi:Pup amidohydrolase